MTLLPSDLTLVADAWLFEASRLSWQVAAFVAVVALLAFAARRARPEVRYLLWSLVLLRLLLPVGFSSPFGLLPVRGDAESRTTVAVLDTPTLADPAVAVSPGRTLDLAFVAMLAWMTGVALLAGLAAASSLAARRAIARGSAVRRETAERAARLSSDLGLSRPPRVVVRPTDSRIPAPAVFGLRRPTIVLPAYMNDDWSLDEQEPVLLHELNHLRRRDHLVNALQVTLQIVYFFHPLVWLANWRLRAERELACDDAVVRQLGGPSRYARSLVRYAECHAGKPDRTALAVGMAESTGTVSRRIARMFDPSYSPRLKAPLRSRTITACLVAIALVSLVLAADATGRHPGLSIAAEPTIDSEILYTEAFVPPGSLGGPAPPESIYPVEDLVTLGRETSREPLDDPALIAGREGSVVVGAWIDVDGTVRDAEVHHGVGPNIDRMFERYLEGFRFEPSRHAEAGAVALRILVNFVFPAQQREREASVAYTDGPFVPGVDDVGAPRRLNHVDPLYPDRAREARIEGKVILRAVIDTNGAVRDIEVLKQPAAGLGFAEAAIAAASQWRYEPALRNGEPVPVYFTFVVNFTFGTAEDAKQLVREAERGQR